MPSRVIFLTTVGPGSWSVPSDWNSDDNSVEVIGGGGGGGAFYGDGGDGGGYAKATNLSYTPGTVVNFSVGAGGIGGHTGTVGDDTWFDGTSATPGSSKVSATGGQGGYNAHVAGTGTNPTSGGLLTSGGIGGPDGGGGGAGGPHGNGGNGGGDAPGTGSNGGGGGGADGGSDGGNVLSVGYQPGGAGGNNHLGSGGGAGGTGVAGAGQPGVNGGGGGGGSGNNDPTDPPTVPAGDGGNGGTEQLWDATHGPGGGGGTGGWTNLPDLNCAAASGDGGLYGGGGGGYSNGVGGSDGLGGGNGAQGIIVITYSPSSGPVNRHKRRKSVLQILNGDARPVPFFLASSSDGVTGVTGASPTVTISKNGAGFAAPAGAVTEIGNGWYALTPSGSDVTTNGALVLHATASGADPTNIERQVVAINPYDAERAGLAALPNAAAGATGGLLTSASLPANFGALGISLGGGVLVGSYASGVDPASLLLVTPANKIATDSSNRVSVGSNADKTGYSLSNSQTFNLTGNINGSVSGSVASVTAPVTVGTNQDKSGYTLTQSFPGNFGLLAIDNNGMIAVNNFAAGLLDLANGVESGLTVRQSLRLQSAFAGGVVAGSGTNAVSIAAAGNPSIIRVVGSVDAYGNRSAVTLNL